MPIIGVPRAFRPGLIAIAQLPEENFQALVSALSSIREISDTKTASEDLYRYLGDAISKDDIAQIVQTISSLGVGLETLDVPREEFASSIASSVVEGGAASGINRETLSSRLSRILSVDQFSKTGKALALLVDHQRIMLRSRILTDLRPVFTDNVKELPDAAVLVQTLKIEYSEGAERKTFFIAMDDNDLEALSKACARAKDKAETLRSWVKKSDVRLIQAPSD